MAIDLQYERRRVQGRGAEVRSVAEGPGDRGGNGVKRFAFRASGRVQFCCALSVRSKRKWRRSLLWQAASCRQQQQRSSEARCAVSCLQPVASVACFGSPIDQQQLHLLPTAHGQFLANLPTVLPPSLPSFPQCKSAAQHQQMGKWEMRLLSQREGEVHQGRQREREGAQQHRYRQEKMSAMLK